MVKEGKKSQGQTQNHLQETRTITRGNYPELSTTSDNTDWLLLSLVQDIKCSHINNC